MVSNNSNQKRLEEIRSQINVIENILKDEFPNLPKDRVELIANRIFDELQYVD